MNPDNIKLSSKRQQEIFYKEHGDCDCNSENYGGTIELIFCKDHADYHNPNRKYRPKGTYIFIDSDVK